MTAKENLELFGSSNTNSQTIIATVAVLSDKGEGIIFDNGSEIYIKGVVPKDEVEINVGQPFVEGSKRRPGELIRLIRPSPDRKIDSECCKYVSLCGGCPLGSLSFNAQYRFKMALIDDALIKAGIKNFKQSPFVASDAAVSRHKSIRFFANSGKGLIQGFYQSRSHDVCCIDRCQSECEWFSALAQELCNLANTYGIKAYDEHSVQGLLRALMMRDCGENERIAVLTYCSVLPQNFIEELKALYLKHHIKAGFIQQNETHGNKIISGELTALTKDKSVRAVIGGYAFDVGPQTFLQVNYDIAQKLYAAAVKWCGEGHEAEALDLCCGCGTMTLPLSQYFKKVTGVEIIKEATDAAMKNANRAEIDNVEFIAADLKNVLPALARRNIKAVIADPPRVGLGDANCKALKVLPKGTHLAVIFCGLKALSRDVATLVKSGFKLQAVQGFDMFPNAHGCETLCLFEKS